jgi:hypothetical protein
MPRLPRDIEPGVPYHLISRFVDREWFITTEAQRRCYVSFLGRALSNSDWRCFSYAVMSNHVHIGAIAGEQPLDSWVRRVHAPFAGWMNTLHDRIGVMFVRGPKAKPVDPESVGKLIAYIHNNPVRAGVVGDPAATTWTSHRAYVGKASAPSWLHVGEGLALAGFSDRSDFHRWSIDPSRDSEIAEFESEPRTTTKVVRSRVDARVLVAAAAAEFGLPVSRLCSTRRGNDECRAREVAVECAAQMGLSGAAIGVALELSQQAISKIARRVVRSPQLIEQCSRVIARLPMT